MNKLKELFKKENAIKNLKWFFHSFIWLGIILFVIDIVSKHIVLNAFGGWELFETTFENNGFTPVQPVYDVIPSLIGVTFVLNPGMAFGALGDADEVTRRVILIGVSVIMSAAFIFIYVKKFKTLNKMYKAILMCLAAGAIGNLIDRAFYPHGYVIDFIKFTFWPEFAVFNIADATLVVVLVIMIIYMIVEEIQVYLKKRKNPAEPEYFSENEGSEEKNNVENPVENTEEIKEENKEKENEKDE